MQTASTQKHLKGDEAQKFLNSLGVKASDGGDWLTDVEEVFYNLNYETLFEQELSDDQDPRGVGTLTKQDAVAVDTGRYTGRSAKDKYIVKDAASTENIWWAGTGSDNKPIDTETWTELKGLAQKQLSGKRLYIMDLFCGANPKTRLPIRLITEIPWKAHFAKNMFIRPTDAELENFKPGWTILDACKTTCKGYKELGLRSETFVAFNLTEKQTVIGGTWYGGEIKKGIFTMMNYYLPMQGIGAFHCSSNKGESGDTALFFGLSGTGKTTLSADPKRALIGDDEHGWDEDGVFNFEGGCYAKCIDLSEENEPDIYRAIRRNALLENVTLREDKSVDYADVSKTQNTRVSYPIHHIENIVKPVSRGGHPKNIVFLTADAFGVLPPVAKLNPEQAQYQYLSGYTAKVAGTELGVTEPTATFSPCFGGPFLSLHPTRYSAILAKKMLEHGSNAYLVNTGWSGGPYGEGSRMKLSITRAIIDAILDGSIEKSEWETFEVFGLKIPKTVDGVPGDILHPRKTWKDGERYDGSLRKLGGMFIENFASFTDNAEGKNLVAAGPQL